jgi:DNA-binding IclR family transcriptional regulator
MSMAPRNSSNKAKIARRVVEVLEFLDARRHPATVMDIARRFDWPQSSTSELLLVLVETGVLYKDDRSRSFALTPRAAMLGASFQPRMVRDGRLAMLTEDLRRRTGLSVAVMGKVGLDVQIFGWTPGAEPASADPSAGLAGGMLAPLHESVAGWLLLSTLPERQRDGVLRRLRAEGPAERRFQPAMLNERIAICEFKGHGVGPAGFGSTAEMCAILLPAEAGESPMALGFVYAPARCSNPTVLIELLKGAAQTCAAPPPLDPAPDLRQPAAMGTSRSAAPRASAPPMRLAELGSRLR